MTPERWNEIQKNLDMVVTLIPSERESFLQKLGNTDLELRQELESLLSYHFKDPEFLRTSAIHLLAQDLCREQIAMPPVVGRVFGTYRLTKLLGTGGMGEVYRAYRADDQYNKEVAIKLVRAEQNSTFVISRFKNERQVLASLDHPNISRLLDGGTTQDGIPYFVMELIEGQPLTDYCDHHKLATTQRLQLFLEVCSAVQYAHQRLIIHRDLKPSNILVTRDGIPKLLDFGIAKILDQEGAPKKLDVTMSMFRLLTLAYASPEQVKGELITTATDVYSLGVILYECLTGHRPYPATAQAPHEISRAVCEIEAEKPSTVIRCTKTRTSGEQIIEITPAAVSTVRDGTPDILAKRLRGDLDNIALMALRKEPQRRYASVEQLSTDIRRHLDHLPVIASKDTVRYRTAKFVARHRTGVVAAVALFLVVFAGMATTLYEAHRVKQNELRAERRFNDVRKLANSLLFDIHDSVKDLPGSTPARKLIVQNALQYLDGLARESQGDSNLQRELGAAYNRVGDVQGYKFNANLGDTTAALTSYQKALEIRKSLYSSNPGNLTDAKQLSESFRLVSQTQCFNNNLANALNNAMQAARIAEPLARSNPNDGSILLELILAYQSVANILGGPSLSNLGDNAAAMVYRRKQLETAEQLAKLDPTSAVGQGNLAIALTGLADQLLYGGERLSSRPYYERARSIFADIAGRSLKRRRAVYLLDYVCRSVAIIELSSNEQARALATMQEAVERSKQLSEEDPHDEQSGKALADYDRLLADLESRAGNAQSASASLERATSLMTAFAGRNPTDTERTDGLVLLKVVAGNLADRSGDTRRALNLYVAATVLLERLQSENPHNVAACVRLAELYNKIGAEQIKLHDLKAAATSFRRAQALIDPDAAAARADAEALYAAVDTYGGLGEVEALLARNERHRKNSRIEHWQQAVSLYEQCLSAVAHIMEPGAVSPDGFDVTPQAVASRQLMLARATLSRLTRQAR
jgi:eukaryotic-like serine/threonine-protein kinase